MTDLYPNLPGYQTVLTGGNMVITSNVATTQSVLLIGTAVDGPVNQPIRITSLTQAEAVFGPMAAGGVRNGSTLVSGFQEAVEAGCQDVRLLRYSGVKATATIADTSTTPVDVIKLTALNAGELYHTMTAEIDTSGDGCIFTLTPPVGKGTPLIITVADGTTVEALVALINEDPANAFVYAEVLGSSFNVACETLADATETFAGGDDQLVNSVELQKDLLHGKTVGEVYTMGTYDVLKDYNVDLIGLLGVYADTGGTDTETVFAEKLAEHCAAMSAKDNVTIGVMSVSPFADLSLVGISGNIARLIALDHFYGDFSESNELEAGGEDEGRFLNILVGEGFFRSSKVTAGEYKNTLVAAYAGFISALAPQSSTTNKQLPNVKRLAYTLSLSQLNDLTGKKYTTVRQKDNGVYVVSGITCAQDGNVYQRLSSVRIIGIVVDTIVRAADPFIGEPNSLINRNTLHTAIKSSLDALQSVGIITNYKFVLFASTSDLVNGILNVELEVVPAFELRKIKTTITLRTNL